METTKKSSIELYEYPDAKSKQMKMDLLDENEMTIATLDSRDFREMVVMKLNRFNREDIFKYTNQYKGTNIQ